MSREIIDQVKEAERRITQLGQDLEDEKIGLQDKLTQEIDAFKESLDQQLNAHETALEQQNETRLEEENAQFNQEAEEYRHKMTDIYSQQKEGLITKGIEEVMNAYGYRKDEAADNR
ncbi:hypothetical protein HZY88_10870 [Aerococcaceae bacterium DSM 111176]|nr:hypothetical protein [Aerococcaceae bacterium DSM 111176]